MECNDQRDCQASPGTELDDSMSSTSGKAGKMPDQAGEIMDIEYFTDNAEGKKKRRRGRLIIFVDESEERTRWVPWILLAAVIIGAVVAAVVVIRFAVNSDDGTQSSAAKTFNPNNGGFSSYPECQSMMARLRQTSQEHGLFQEISHQSEFLTGSTSKPTTPQYTSTSRGQHDVLVPIVEDILDLSDSRVTPSGDGHMYAGSGTQLKVISTHGRRDDSGTASSPGLVVATLDFASLDAFQFAATLMVSGAEGSISIPYGLGSTFKVDQLFLPPEEEASNPRLLAVVGSATNAAPVFPGPSPRLKFNPDGPTYESTDLRPFNTTVLIIVDISNPLEPQTVSISEFEGHFVTIEQEQSHLWLFIRSSAHIPSHHSSSDDSALKDDIMPLFRNLPVLEDNSTASTLPWSHMGACESVQRLELGVPRAYDNYLLAAVPVLVKQANQTQPIGEVKAQDINLVVQGWATGMVPVLTAKAPGWLNLYLAEGIRYTPQPIASAASSSASVITAVSYFRLIGGLMEYKNSTIVYHGEMRVEGAMHFISSPPQLSLLTSQDGDSSTGSTLQSSLTLYSPSLSTEDIALGQLRERVPTGLIYPTADNVFISFDVKSLPLVQVVPIRRVAQATSEETAQESRRSGASDTRQQSVQRLRTQEHVELMKAIVLTDKNGSPGDNILLVAGGRVLSADDDYDTTEDGSLQDELPRSYQFSLYSYTPGTASTFEVRHSNHITTGTVESEAFVDPRAALLFQVPGDVPGHAYFAFPVEVSSQTELAGLGCSTEQGFRGTLVWRILFGDTARSGVVESVTTQKLAAVPAWGSCGYRSGTDNDDMAVKRLRLLNAHNGLHLAALSRCVLGTVPWTDIALANRTTVDSMHGQWIKIEPKTEQLFSTDCSPSAE